MGFTTELILNRLHKGLNTYSSGSNKKIISMEVKDFNVSKTNDKMDHSYSINMKCTQQMHLSGAFHRTLQHNQ